MQKNIIIGIVFLFGLGIFLYPNLSNIYAEYSQAITIYDYQKQQQKLDEQAKEIELEKLQEYNQSLKQGTIEYVDPFENDDSAEIASMEAEDMNDSRLGEPLGHIEIPKINIDIPIYKGTTDYILQRGIGLLPNSSMPVGGENTHTALTGHRGLPSAELFTDIVDLKIDDIFYIHSVAGTLAYQIESIETVLPHETDSLKIQEGRDLATLITCTPYMINTHRILITGTRIPYVPIEENEPISRKMIQYVVEKEQSVWIYGVTILLFSAIFIIVFIVVRKRKKVGDES